MDLEKKKQNFKSAPWCVNGHVHTVLCSILAPSPALNYERVIVDTPDDDFLEIDVSEQKTRSPVAILLHGLEGHSKRYYVTQLGEQLFARGFSIVSINFRGCGSKMNRQRKFYHSGETEDLHTIFNWVDREYPGMPMFCAGFSLGGSALMNYLKEHSTHHPLKAAATISTPFHLENGSHNLEKGFNKLYSIRFLRTLVKKLEEKRKQFPDLPAYSGSTLYEFDDQVTAPIHGFESAEDYYHQCASYFFMDKIKTNTLVVHSKEDPMCPFKWTPIDDIRKNPFTEPCFTEKGGHVGFWSLPGGWLNETVADYFKSFI